MVHVQQATTVRKELETIQQMHVQKAHSATKKEQLTTATASHAHLATCAKLQLLQLLQVRAQLELLALTQALSRHSPSLWLNAQLTITAQLVPTTSSFALQVSSNLTQALVTVSHAQLAVSV